MSGHRPEPSYADLPELGKLGFRHSWDTLSAPWGTLARIGPDAVVEAAGLVRTGEVFPLNLGIDAFDPPLFGRSAVTHRMFPHDRNTFEDRIDGFNPQASSQWDGLGHVRAREYGWFGGVAEDEVSRRLGMHHWARRGIAGRGVLLDVAGYREEAGIAYDPFGGEAILPDELLAIAEATGTEFRRGDVVCVRFGWLAEYRRRAASGAGAPEITRWSGLSGAEGTARFLWDHGAAAVAADNPAVEPAPGSAEDGSLHRRLIPALGFALAELLDLERLAEACRRQNRWEFLFVGVPLPIEGGVSSPSNAVAIL